MGENHAPNQVFTVARRVDTADEMHALGLNLAEYLRAGDLIVMNGQLGAGKTTLTRGLGEGLGARGAITSPTFVLARTHPTTSGLDLVHVDAYRLADAVELDDLDIPFDRSITVVEWGGGLLDGVSEAWLEIDIERDAEGLLDADTDGDVSFESDTPRMLTITGFGERWRGFGLDLR